MRKLGSWFVPYLMGFLMVVEGAITVVLARGIELVDVVEFDRTSVMIAGAVLMVLGILLYAPILPHMRNKLSVKRLQIAVALIVLIFSLIIVLIAAPAVIEDYGTISKHWVVLAGAQLFLLAIVAFVFSYYVPLEDPNLAWVEWVGMLASSMVMVQGIVIFGMRATFNFHGERPVGPEIMIIFAVALVALGLWEMVIFNLRQEGRSERSLNRLTWAGVLISIIIGVMGLVILFKATSMTIGGAIFGVEYVLLGGFMLAILGALLNYTQTLVGGQEGRAADVGLLTTMLLFVAIPIAALL